MSAHLCSWDAVGMSIVDVLAAWSRAPAVGARLVLLVGVLCSCSNLPGRSAVCFEGEGRRPVSRGLGGRAQGSRFEGGALCNPEKASDTKAFQAWTLHSMMLEAMKMKCHNMCTD